MSTTGLAGTGTLIRFNLRRDRVRTPVWLAAIALVQLSGPATYVAQFPSPADRQDNAGVIGGSPAGRAFSGPGHGLDDYTYGAMMGNEYLGYMLIFVALMSVLMVVRHTRTEEETGRAELVRAGPVGRYAHLTAALVTAAIANVALGLLIAVGMAAQGVESIDWRGSIVFGAAYTVVGLVFAAIAGITVQVSAYARAAAGMAGVLIAVAYGVRAIGDVGENAVSWLSPIGWAQASAPYVDNRWWPLGLALVVAAVLVAAAFALSDRRDFAAGLRPERTGAAHGSPRLGTAFGLAWRLQRSSAGWWGLGMLLGGIMFGSFADAIEGYEDNDFVQEFIQATGGATLVESFASIAMAIFAIVCGAFAILAVLRLRHEETAGRAEPVLATAVSRIRLFAGYAGIAMVGGTGLLLLAGLGFGAGAAAVTGDGGYLGEVLGPALAYAPAVWLTAGLAAAVVGVWPRAVVLAWALLVYAGFIAYFGGLLDLPGWLLDLSPYEHVPRLPIDDFNVLPLVILTAIAAGLVAIGLAGFRRRDLESN